MVSPRSHPPSTIPFPIALITLISRRYLEFLVQQVRSPSHPVTSLTALVGLHLITYHKSHLRSSAHPYATPSVKVLADLNEGAPPHRLTNH